MAEYPPRSCGLCPHLGKYVAVANEQGDYLKENTVPKPNMLLDKHITLEDHALGVPRTYEHPDLRVSPVKAQVDCCCPLKESTSKAEPCPESRYSLDTIRKKQQPAGAADALPSNQQLGVVGARRTLYSGGSPEPRSNGSNVNDVSVARDTPPSDRDGPTDSKPLKGILKKTEKLAAAPCPCEEKMKISAVCPEGQDIPEIVRTGLSAEISEPKTNEGRPPCYLPQPEDLLPTSDESMGPIGPWATGRVDWGPLSGLTGTRPIVDKYSIARFSEGEWRMHNKNMLDTTDSQLHRGNLIEWNTRQALEQTRADTDKNQEDSTKRLMQREQELHRWKCELERAIDAAAEEIAIMEQERRRLKHAMAVLMMPESIAGECLERRTSRLDPELVRDEVEEELIKEMALTAEIREIFTKALKDVEMQLLEDKTAKQRLEYDWSDKRQAHDLEVINVALNNQSNIMLFKSGAVRFPDNQSSPEHWENFTRETLQESEATRQRSVALRGTLNAILENASRDLRTQADRVDAALSKRIACMEEIRIRLENQLHKVLQQLADVEDLIKNLRNTIRRMDIPMKKAQTRLDNRNNRPRVENCRDVPQFGLVEEVKLIGENVSALTSQLNQAEQSQADLMKARSNLEREIMVKRKTLEIDRDRIQVIRTHYPSATALSGH